MVAIVLMSNASVKLSPSQWYKCGPRKGRGGVVDKIQLIFSRKYR